MTSRRQVLWGGAIVAGGLLIGCRAEPDEAAGGQPGSAQAGDRVVTDSVGEVRVPRDATRIVTVHHIATQPLTDLGILPVGRGDVERTALGEETWAKIADIPVVTTGGEVNVEAIAELDPDLVIAHNRVDEGVLDSLRQLGPLLLVDIAGAGRADWQGKTRLIAEALGKEAEFEALVAEHEQRAADIAETHAAALEKETFSVVGTWDTAELILYSDQSNFGKVFALAGATLVPGPGTAEDGEDVLSLEEIGEFVTGTTILHGSDYAGEPNTELAETMDSAVFRRLPAVTEGRIFPGGKATLGGFEDAALALDELEKVLTVLAT